MYLPDKLLEAGFRNIRVVDIAPSALEQAQARLGDLAGQITWIPRDIRKLELEAEIGLWHDRAVFHFMNTPELQHQYRQVLIRALQPGGYAVLAAFSQDGPERCSGLAVQQYEPRGLADYFGPELSYVVGWKQVHTTPDGKPQTFSWAILQKE
jgi:SAM-dependent methyltransferase